MISKTNTNRIFLLFILFITSSLINAQEKPVISEQDWEAIIPHLNNEDWVSAEKMSSDFLNRFKSGTDTSDEAGIVRYMYLKCVAALVGSKEISKDEGIKRLKILKGKNIITPFIMFKQDGMFNYLKVSDDEKFLSHCSSNNSATEIHMFEYYDVNDKSLLNSANNMDSKQYRLSATVSDIKVEGFTMPRVNVNFINTLIWDAM